MRITKIEPQKHHPNRYSIYIDDKFAIGINETTLFSLNIKEGTEITKDELEKIVYTETKSKIKEQAINLLSYRARSKKELKDRLIRKGNELNYINEVLQDLEENGLINDLEFATSWIRERGKTRGHLKLKNELFLKGISEELINKAFESTDISESEVAQQLADKWLRLHSHNEPSTQKLKQKLFAFLTRRGINYDTVSEIISQKLTQ